jgi:hypothetical protein
LIYIYFLSLKRSCEVRIQPRETLSASHTGKLTIFLAVLGLLSAQPEKMEHIRSRNDPQPSYIADRTQRKHAAAHRIPGIATL